MGAILSQGIPSEAEFNAAKNETQSETDRKELPEWWLDLDTFKLTSVVDDIHAFQNVTAADVDRVARRLIKNPVVLVTVTQKSTPSTK